MDGLLDWVGVGGHVSIYYGCPFTPRTTLVGGIAVLGRIAVVGGLAVVGRIAVFVVTPDSPNCMIRHVSETHNHEFYSHFLLFSIIIKIPIIVQKVL
jgi:hypothetical protein